MSHALATLAVGASNVLNAKHENLTFGKRIATLDDKMLGSMLANEVMATVQTQGQVWRGFAMRIINTNHEARAAFVQAIDSTLKEMRGANTIDDTVAAKDAKKRVNTATVEVSKLRIVAKAWNSGATIPGLVEYVRLALKQPTAELEHIGYTMLVEYARTFSQSKAGRPAKAWAEKLGDWLDKNAPDEDDAKGNALREKFIAMLNGEQPPKLMALM